MRFDNEVILSIGGRNCPESTCFLSEPVPKEKAANTGSPDTSHPEQRALGRTESEARVCDTSSAVTATAGISSGGHTWIQSPLSPSPWGNLSFEIRKQAILRSAVGGKFLSFKLLL